jgi:hypothetical protein
MNELDSVVRVWAADYYLALPDARRAGVGVFVADMLELLRLPGVLGRARKAAQVRKTDYVVVDLTPAQTSLRAAIIDHYRRASRQHPHLADEATAFADAVVTFFRPDTVEAAVDHADRCGAAAERLAETEHAWWSKAQIARNQRPPSRRRLYDI